MVSFQYPNAWQRNGSWITWFPCSAFSRSQAEDPRQGAVASVRYSYYCCLPSLALVRWREQMFRIRLLLPWDEANRLRLLISTGTSAQISPAFKLGQTVPAPLTTGFNCSSPRSGSNLFNS